MYRITTPSGESILTDNVNYIRVHRNGVFTLTDASLADGVAHNSTPYLYEDGTKCERVNTADVFVSVDEMAKAIREGVNEA